MVEPQSEAEERATDLIAEWQRANVLVSPAKGRGEAWWRRELSAVGYIDARVLQLSDPQAPPRISATLGSNPPRYDGLIYRVQNPDLDPGLCWWDRLEWAAQHLQVHPDFDVSIIQGHSVEHVYATIRYDRVTLSGAVEAGPVEVVAEVDEWEEDRAGSVARRQRRAFRDILFGAHSLDEIVKVNTFLAVKGEGTKVNSFVP